MHFCVVFIGRFRDVPQRNMPVRSTGTWVPKGSTPSTKPIDRCRIPTQNGLIPESSHARWIELVLDQFHPKKQKTTGTRRYKNQKVGGMFITYLFGDCFKHNCEIACRWAVLLKGFTMA